MGSTLNPPPSLPAESRQVIVIDTLGNGLAQGVRFERSADQWRKVGTVFTARVSNKARTPINKRIRNTGTTPVGTFALDEAFGFVTKPLSGLPYRKATSNSWWVADPASPLDDSWQECTSNCSWDEREGERLIDHRASYELAIHVATKSPNAAAIFIHLDTGRNLSGCIAVSKSTMVTLLKWLSKEKNPYIVITT